MAQSAEDFLLYHKFGHVSITNNSVRNQNNNDENIDPNLIGVQK